MLERVEIKNFALIEKAKFEPGHHFSVISGETGAGKSLLIDALGSLTGKRARREVVRKGSDFARIEAFFSFQKDREIPKSLNQYLEDNQIVLSREINADGGSQARINGRLCSISLLREISSHLIGLHAQHEQLAIFDPAEQRSLLDKFAEAEILPLLSTWSDLVQNRRILVEKIREYGLFPAERTRQLDLLHYQVQEIREAALHVDEEAKLLERNKILSKLSRIKKDLYESREMLSNESNHSAGSMISEAVSLLDYSARSSKEILELRNRLSNLAYELSDITAALEDTFGKIEAEPGEVEKVNRRLDQINRLKLKYGDSLEEVLRFAEQSEKRIDELVSSEHLFEEYRIKLLENDTKMASVAQSIHQIRKKYASLLSEKICEALASLAMPDVSFEIRVEEIAKNEKGYYGKYGRDQIDFLIRTNVGEDLMPLSQIASGGEVSRILLAIKSIFGRSDQLAVFIFDEIDTGISGETATKVAGMLRELASDKQVLCVSHMAQVAAAADTHFLIVKSVSEGRTRTEITKLDDQEKIREVARLLSGEMAQENSLKLADTLLRQYPGRP